MKRLIFTVVLATVLMSQTWAQEPAVSIKIDSSERFRFEGNALKFMNDGRNVVIGDSCGMKMDPNTSYNVYIGFRAASKDTLGQINVFVGGQAGYSNTTGHRNTFIGFGAGQNNTTGFRNTYVGLSAGVNNTIGAYNTMIGRASGWENIEGSGNVFLGNGAGYYETGSNRLHISNQETTAPLIYGEFDNGFVRFNAYNTETTGDFMSYGKVRANDRFSLNGTLGISDTVSYVTNIDFPNGLLKYKTVIYTGGIVTYSSEESAWVSQVGDPIFTCGQISLIGEFSGWSMDQFMSRDVNNPNLWTTTMYLSAGNDFIPQDGYVEMKFRENQSWDVNWGSDQFPSGIAVSFGPNIMVPLNINFTTTIYLVTFNCQTGEFSFQDISQ